MRHASLFGLILIVCTAPMPVFAGAPAPSDADKEFVSVCAHAFLQSSGEKTAEAQAFARQICECTIQESKHQGATVAAVKSETAKIKADAKHKIADPRLLAAFQFCTIELLRDDGQAFPEAPKSPKKAK